MGFQMATSDLVDTRYNLESLRNKNSEFERLFNVKHQYNKAKIAFYKALLRQQDDYSQKVSEREREVDVLSLELHRAEQLLHDAQFHLKKCKAAFQNAKIQFKKCTSDRDNVLERFNSASDNLMTARNSLQAKDDQVAERYRSLLASRVEMELYSIKLRDISIDYGRIQSRLERNYAQIEIRISDLLRNDRNLLNAVKIWSEEHETLNDFTAKLQKSVQLQSKAAEKHAQADHSNRRKSISDLYRWRDQTLKHRRHDKYIHLGMIRTVNLAVLLLGIIVPAIMWFIDRDLLVENFAQVISSATPIIALALITLLAGGFYYRKQNEGGDKPSESSGNLSSLRTHAQRIGAFFMRWLSARRQEK